MRLAEFFGVECQTVPLHQVLQQQAENAASFGNACIVANHRVIEEYSRGDRVSQETVSLLLTRFGHVLVHVLQTDPACDSLISALSQNQLRGARQINASDSRYRIHKDATDICGPFSGLEFGPTNRVNDRCLEVGSDCSGVRQLISIGDRPFMISMKAKDTEVLVLGTADVIDLDSRSGDSPVAENFSRLVPHVMALRHIFREECWQTPAQRACVIIDDPLLRRKYGFLNFEHLFALVQQHKFHASIAFIPHNYRRNSQRIVDAFHSNREYVSICYHGNDHTEAELASNDSALLHALLMAARARMKQHETSTGLRCDNIMVFPQGAFSYEVMEALKLQGFLAAVNTGPYPKGGAPRLSVREIIQPAVLRYGFPLFLRQYVKEIQDQDIAFNLLFGRPVLIVEHHQIFQNPELLVDVVRRVHSIAPRIQWSCLEHIARRTVLTRRGTSGSRQFRCCCGTVQIDNDSDGIEHISAEWLGLDGSQSLEKILVDGVPSVAVERCENTIRVGLEMRPKSSHTFCLVHRSVQSAQRRLGFRWETKAFIRRRLSEIRDNHFSRNPRLLSIARALQQRYIS